MRMSLVLGGFGIKYSCVWMDDGRTRGESGEVVRYMVSL